MGMGAVLYLIGAMATFGLHLVTDGYIWLIILGLALPATAISNITLVRAIKYAGPNKDIKTASITKRDFFS